MESYKKDKHQLLDQKDGKSLTEENNITNSIPQAYQILTEQLRIAQTTKSWKLMCLLRRINEQLFKGNFNEKKKFFLWIKNKILKKPVLKELELAKFSPITMESIHFEKELSLSKKWTLAFIKLIKPAHRIADLGSGSGSFWWTQLPEDVIVDAYDLYNKPSKSLPNINFYSLDCTELYKHSELQEKYDIVVADHVFEHVATPEQFADSINFILKPGGYLHIGIPDASNFTDRLYRLIHRNGGGHIQQYTTDSFISFMDSFGFILKELSPWPDDWLWLEKCFDIEYHGIEYFTYEEKKYIADVFRKELTPEKGYLYGWEYLFVKKNSYLDVILEENFKEPILVDVLKSEIRAIKNICTKYKIIIDAQQAGNTEDNYQGRFQINWQENNGNFVKSSLIPFTLNKKQKIYISPLIGDIPAEAVTGILYLTGHDEKTILINSYKLLGVVNKQLKKKELKQLYIRGVESRNKIINTAKISLAYINDIEKVKIDTIPEEIKKTLLSIVNNNHVKQQHYINIDKILNEKESLLENEKLIPEFMKWSNSLTYLENLVIDIGINLYKLYENQASDLVNKDPIYRLQNKSPHKSILEETIKIPSGKSKIYSTFLGQLFYIEGQKPGIINILTGIEHIFFIYFSIFWEFINKEINFRSGLMEGLLQKNKIQAYPAMVIIDTNNTCNFKCKMCLAQSFGVKVVSANFNKIEHIKDIFSYTRSINLAGTGEPLLNPFLNQLSNLCMLYGQKIETITNGSLIHKKIEMLKNFNLISISFDGALKRTFETLRKGSNYKKIIDNIKLLRNTYPRKHIQLSATISRLNVDEIEGIVKIADDLDVNSVVLFPIITVENTDFLNLKKSDFIIYKSQIKNVKDGNNQYRTIVYNNINQDHFKENNDNKRNKEELYNLVENIKPLKIQVLNLEEIKTLLNNSIDFKYYPESLEIDDNNYKNEDIDEWENIENIDTLQMKLKDMIVNNDKIKLPHCMAPWCMSYINADNSMRACCLLDLNSYIADNRFTEIWNSQIYRELRSAMYYHSSLPEKCVNCQDSFRYSWIKEAITYILMPLEIDFNKIEYPRNFNIERLYEIYELHGFLRVHSRFIEIELESKWKRNKIYSTFFGQLFYIKVQKVSIIRILGVMEHMFSIYVSIFLG